MISTRNDGTEVYTETEVTIGSKVKTGSELTTETAR
jgi:hypothetical protein